MIITCGSSSIFCLFNHAKTNPTKGETMIEMKCIRSKSNLDIYIKIESPVYTKSYIGYCILVR